MLAAFAIQKGSYLPRLHTHNDMNKIQKYSVDQKALVLPITEETAKKYQAYCKWNDVEPVVNELANCLHDVINQACNTGRDLDSLALTAYAEGLILLSQWGMVNIKSACGRRIIAENIHE